MRYTPKPPLTWRAKLLVWIGALGAVLLAVFAAIVASYKPPPFGEWERIVPYAGQPHKHEPLATAYERISILPGDRIRLRGPTGDREWRFIHQPGDNGRNHLEVSAFGIQNYTLQRTGDVLEIVYYGGPLKRAKYLPGAVLYRRVGSAHQFSPLEVALQRLCDRGVVVSIDGDEAPILVGAGYHADYLRQEDFDALGQFGELRELRVSGALASDANLERVGQWPKLEVLSVRGPLTEASVRHFSALGALRELELTNCRPGDAGWAALAQCQRLESLSLWGTTFADADVAHLKALPALKNLKLGSTDISRARVGDFLKFDRLEHLSWHNPQLGEDDLIRLARMKGLRSLDMSGCYGLTREGVREFRRLRPDVALKVAEHFETPAR